MAGDKTWKFMECIWVMMKSIAKVESKVLTVLKKIDENISQEDIDVAHRLGKSKKTKPPTSLSDLSLEKPETIFIKKGRN